MSDDLLAAERERCAQVCDAYAAKTQRFAGTYQMVAESLERVKTAETLAAQIREMT